MHAHLSVQDPQLVSKCLHLQRPEVVEQRLLCSLSATRYMLSRILRTGFKTAKYSLSWYGKNIHIYTHACIMHLHMHIHIQCIIIYLWQFKMFSAKRPTYNLFKENGSN